MNIPLPKITHPTFELTLPSSGRKYSFRPLETRERKVLLMAMESGDEAEISRAIRSIVSACIVDLKVDAIAVFDLEWAFIQLVIHSIKDTLDLEVRIPGRENDCPDCAKSRVMKVDLREAKVLGVLKDKKDFTIEVGAGLGIKLRYPTEKHLGALDLESKEKPEIEKLTDLISLSIESVFDGTTTYPFSEYTYKERIEFLESLPVPVTDKLEAFVQSTPRLSLDIKVQCPTCHFEVAHRLVGLADFFV